MSFCYEPKADDVGIMQGTEYVPATLPVSYTPCKGESGVKMGSLFMPLEPPCGRYYYSGGSLYTSGPIGNPNFPFLKGGVVIDREPPFYNQTGLAVATACVSPYNWTVASGQANVTILDTTPDAVASEEEKALPGYVPNPGLTLSSRTHADFDPDAYDDVTGLGYIWMFAADESELRWTAPSPPVSPNPGRVVLRSVNLSDTILYSIDGSTPSLPYPDGGFTITASKTVKWTVNAGPVRSQFITYPTTPSQVYRITVTPADPHPELRPGQTRYSVPSVSKTGTDYDGTPFLPATNPVSGTLRVCAYHYGLLLSTITSTSIRLKVGKASATWSKTGGTLTLSSAHPDCVFYYSTDGSAPTVKYTAPISISSTTTVRWYAVHGCMLDSDEWSTEVTFTGGEGPADFETAYFSALTAFSNSPVQSLLKFQRRADWYVTVGGSGDGLTPGSPASAEEVLGLTTQQGWALGPRRVYVSYYSASSLIGLAFASSYTAISGGSYILYTFGTGEPDTLYTGLLTISSPCTIRFRAFRTVGDVPLTYTYDQPLYIGPVVITADWNLSTGYLTLSSDAVGQDIWYSTSGAFTPSYKYTGPIQVTATTTFRVKVKHPVGAAPDVDLPTETTMTTLPVINPLSTPSYTNTYNKTFQPPLDGTSTFSQGSDIVWCAEGEYVNPTGNVDDYFSVNTLVVVRGGFNSAFTSRDVKNQKTIFTTEGWNDGTPTAAINVSAFQANDAVLDGLWFDTGRVIKGDPYNCYPPYYKWLQYALTSYCVTGNQATVLYNCHIDHTDTIPGGQGGSGLPYAAGSGPSNMQSNLRILGTIGFSHCCTITVDVTIEDAGDGASESGFGGSNLDNYIQLGNLGTTTSGSGMFSDIDISLTVGKGGNGAAGVSINERGGLGGGASGYLYADGGMDGRIKTMSTLNLSCVVGPGGDGGDGGPDTGDGYDGGLCVATLNVGNISNVTGSITCTALRGGNGGDGQDGIPPHRKSYGGNGGWSQAHLDCDIISYSTMTLTCTSGNGGNGGYGQPEFVTDPPKYTYGYGQATISDLQFAMGNKSDLTVNATSGNGGTGNDITGNGYTWASVTELNFGQMAYDFTLAGGVECGVKGDVKTSIPYPEQEWLKWPVYPLWFRAGAITFTEGRPYGPGNPVRVDHGDLSTVGWYSGLDNGDGAPLDGYETPQGTGIALGRYWE